MSTGAWRETLITVCCRLFNKAKTQCLYCRCWEGNIDYSVLQNVKQAKNTVSTGAGREILITVCCRMLSKAKTQCLQVPGEGNILNVCGPRAFFVLSFASWEGKRKILPTTWTGNIKICKILTKLEFTMRPELDFVVSYQTVPGFNSWEQAGVTVSYVRLKRPKKTGNSFYFLSFFIDMVI